MSPILFFFGYSVIFHLFQLKSVMCNRTQIEDWILEKVKFHLPTYSPLIFPQFISLTHTTLSHLLFHLTPLFPLLLLPTCTKTLCLTPLLPLLLPTHTKTFRLTPLLPFLFTSPSSPLTNSYKNPPSHTSPSSPLTNSYKNLPSNTSPSSPLHLSFLSSYQLIQKSSVSPPISSPLTF